MKNTKVNIPNDLMLKIANEYQSGSKILRLSKVFGFGEKPIIRHLSNMGLYRHHPRQWTRLIGKENELKALYKTGKTLKQLAEMYGVTSMVMEHFFKKQKVATRNKNRAIGQEKDIVSAYQVHALPLHQIAKDFFITVPTVRLILNKEGVLIRDAKETTKLRFLNGKYTNIKRYEADLNMLDNVDSPEKAYFLGFFYADGYNNEKKGHVIIELQKRDHEILEKFRLLFRSSKPIIEEKEGYSKFIIHSKYLSAKLSELGCPQKKSDSLQFPEWLREDLLSHFIRGYFDGDGCLYHKGKQCCVKIISSHVFVKRLSIEIACRADVNASARVVKRSPSMSEVHVYGVQQCKRVLKFLYNGSTLSLERKRLKAEAVLAA